MADGARARADAALLKVPARAADGLHDLLIAHGAVADVGKPSVVALADDGIDALHVDAVLPAAVDGILHQRIGNQSDIQRIGQRDGRFDGAELLDLHQAGGLAEAVEHAARAHNLMDKQVLLRRQHDGDAGLMLLRIYSAMADGDAGHIGDGVALPLGQRADAHAPVGDSIFTHSEISSLAA